MYDVIIVGAGPAGISAAYEAKKKGLDYLLIEKEEVANTIHTFPKGKTVQYYPANVDVIGDMPLPEGTPEDLIKSWLQLAYHKLGRDLLGILLQYVRLLYGLGL